VIGAEEFHASAKAAALWYEAQRKGLGERFVSEVDALIDRIRYHPLQFPVIEPPVRCGLLRRFPCAVYFVAEHEGGGLSWRSCTSIAIQTRGAIDSDPAKRSAVPW
jgi:hypothetical protein